MDNKVQKQRKSLGKWLFTTAYNPSLKDALLHTAGACSHILLRTSESLTRVTEVVHIIESLSPSQCIWYRLIGEYKNAATFSYGKQNPNGNILSENKTNCCFKICAQYMQLHSRKDTASDVGSRQHHLLHCLEQAPRCMSVIKLG